MNIKLTQLQVNITDFILNVSNMPNEGIAIYLEQLLKSALKEKGDYVLNLIAKTVSTFKSQVNFVDSLSVNDIDINECKKEFFSIHYEECLKEVYNNKLRKEQELVPVFIEQKQIA